jgi:hypothetical protein
MCFAIGLCKSFDINTNEYEYVDFYGLDAIDQFLDYISNFETEVPTEVCLYAHNGSRYDLAIINEKLLRHEKIITVPESFVALEGAVISQEIINKNNVRFIFRDSARLIQGSLSELCDSFKPIYRKKTEHEFNFDHLTAKTIFEPKIKDEIVDYLKHDCLSLAEIVIRFRQQLILDPKIQIDITQCYTAASLAKKSYFQNYYARYCNKKQDRYIYELDSKHDDYFRESFFGGRCDMNFYG